ncbi:acyltransferase domain-containing protein, partial [Mycobacterium haemophilum]
HLMRTSPVFAAHIAACEDAMSDLVDWSLTEVLHAAGDWPDLERVEVVQPVLFAIMVALAHHWRSFGLRADAVIGHSQGEIAAAHFAGILSLRDAVRIVTLRSQLLTESVAGAGSMVSIACDAETAAGIVKRWSGRLDIAAINSPESTVIAGDMAAINELLQWCGQADIRARRISVDYASHTRHVEPVRDKLMESLTSLPVSGSDIELFSTVTGERVDASSLTAAYWYENLRQTVKFADAIRTATAAGINTFVEVSPHPILTLNIEQTVGCGQSTLDESLVVGSLRRDEDEGAAILRAAGELFVHGAHIDWATTFIGRNARQIDLPTYAFQRSQYWLPNRPAASDPEHLGLSKLDHGILRAVLEEPDHGALVLTGQLCVHEQPWLSDHTVHDATFMPATAFVDLALRAGYEAGCEIVDELIVTQPLAVTHTPTQLQVRVTGTSETSRHMTIHSRQGDLWVRHAEGIVSSRSNDDPTVNNSQIWPPPNALALEIDEPYAHLAACGYHYGPSLRTLRHVWRRGEELYAHIKLSDDADPSDFEIHPAFLDAGLHAVLLQQTLEDSADPAIRNPPVMPFTWDTIVLHASRAKEGWARILVGEGSNSISVEIADGAGRPIISIRSLMLRPVPNHAPPTVPVDKRNRSTRRRQQTARLVVNNTGKARHSPLGERFTTLSNEQQRRMLQQLVCDHVVAVLDLTTDDDIDHHRPFREIGFDSLTAVELRNRLKAVTELRLPPTVAFNYPTAAALAEHLHGLLTVQSPSSPIDDRFVLHELTRLEASLIATAADEALRADAVSRLEAILNTLKASNPRSPRTDDDLIDASEEQLYAILEDELRR